MLSLVIDIQSDVIEGTLIKFPPKAAPDNPEILYSASLHIPRKPHTTADYVTKMMLRTVEHLALDVVKKTTALTNESIHSIHYILSSPWVLSHAKTVKIDYEKDTEITEKLIHEIIENDRKELAANNQADMVFVEQKIFDVQLNGYSVENYHGKRARSLKVSFAFTLSSDRIIKKIQSEMSRHLRVKKEHFHSAILLQYLSSRTLAGDGEEYIVLHAHGESTDVVVVKKGFSSYITSFPFGISSLTRKMCTTLNRSYETTCSALSMYMDKKVDEPEQAKLETALKPILKGWQAECVKALRSIGENVTLPRKVHLYIEGKFAPLLKASLEEADFEVVIHEEPLREVHSFALKDVI